VRGPVFREPARFAELLVVNRLEGLSTAHALDFNVDVSDGRAQGVQLSSRLRASISRR
jgi:hypothetical protein